MRIVQKHLPGLIDNRTPAIHYGVTFDSTDHVANVIAIISGAV